MPLYFLQKKKKKPFIESLGKKKRKLVDFLDGPVVKNVPCNAGYMGSIPGWGMKIPSTVNQHHN